MTSVAEEDVTPQAGLMQQRPLQALNVWYKLKPDLFNRRP